MNVDPFKRKKLHKIKGREYLTLMLFHDPTKGAFSIRIPKWLRYPVLVLSLVIVIGVLMTIARIEKLESELVEYKYQTQSSSFTIEKQNKEISDLEATNEERSDQLDNLQDLAMQLQERLVNLEAYRESIDEKIGNTDIPDSMQPSDETEAVEADPIISLDDYDTTKLRSQQSMSDSFDVEYTTLLNDLNSNLQLIEEEQKSYESSEEQLDKMIPKWDATPSILPVKNTRITCVYGNRRNPFGGSSYEFHSGVDLKAHYTDVMATAKGKVVFAGWDGARGYMVLIDHGYGYETLYAHLSKIYVKNGDVVERGDVIAKSGNTGRSTGPHLHYEVHLYGNTMNPKNFF